MKISEKPLYKLLGLSAFSHDFSDSVITDMKMIDQLVSASANFAQSPGVDGLLGGMKDMVVAAKEAIPEEDLNTTKKLLKDMILMPILESPQGMISFQILMTLILHRSLQNPETDELRDLRRAFLYELCSTTNDTVLITTGKTRQVGTNKYEPTTIPVAYKMSDVIDFCIQPVRFDNFLDISLLGKYLSTDPYFIILIPADNLDHKDSTMFNAFKSLVSYNLAYFGHAWQARLGEQKFRPFWCKLLGENSNLIAKLKKFPACTESKQFQKILGQDGLEVVLKMCEITDGVKSDVHRAVTSLHTELDEPNMSIGASSKDEKTEHKIKIVPPSMNFSVDRKTGVVTKPSSNWQAPEGSYVKWKFWYEDIDGTKIDLFLSDEDKKKHSLTDVSFHDSEGKKYYGHVSFRATLVVPEGHPLAVHESISSPELSFTKLRHLEEPSMNFIVDEKTGVVKVPEGWILPEGCAVSWKVETKGKDGRDIPQVSPQIIGADGVFALSYKTKLEQGEEVYAKTFYITITITAPQDSTFPTGISVSQNLSFFRKAPDVEMRVFSSQPSKKYSLPQPDLPAAKSANSVVVLSPEQEAGELWEMVLEAQEFSVQIVGENRVDIILNSLVQLEGEAAKYNTITAQMNGDSITYNPDNLGQSLYQALAKIMHNALRDHAEQKKKVQQALSVQKQEERIRKEYSFIIQSISDFVGRITQDVSLSVDGLSDILKTGERGNIFIWEKGGNIYVRFPKACIIQFNLHSNSVSVVQDGMCELGEEFSADMVVLAKILLPDIAFIYADKIRKGNRQKMLHAVKERREAMPIYMDALSRGTARLMILPKGYHDQEQKGLPPGELPRVEKNISWDNIDIRIAELLLQYPGCTIECCLIKDALQLNGAVSQTDPLEIAKSSRGMHIMRKRILISRRLITNEDKDRMPIENKPYSILESLYGIESIKTVGDLTDTFIISYLQALKEAGIKVHYTHPYTLSRAAFTRPTTAAQ